MANISKLLVWERLLENSELNRCQTITRKKLIMPDGVKPAASGFVGCILTARYSSTMRVVVLYLLIEADVSMESGNRIRLPRRQRVPAIFLQGLSTKGLLQLRC